ncbi:MAG TPA: secondary thiamine-phosphate synthase enzyme YjbQ [bacterium]|uniref:Secondary thiamine-phosphate synthase enzyme n=1 Tax=candidate division TA06 bacterium ADurb.Bin417 TaxID=1852828 RepID=A0A1V5MAQ6_UNCT6|nr:MAG: hypothetical protein BWY73_01359 [candidate division TA06 bacterium ADurb.Bin417]HNQ35620.1 secondary thiamine-phosphate synthase enzyme YjbQ [bacterium]HNS47916.1 secondary thiamine-phosphate synthase enzyme YjbQ [bacterium]
MKSVTEHLSFCTKQRREFVNITERIQTLVVRSGIREGLCLVNSMHITSSVFINDEEPGLKRDFQQWLDRLVPEDPSLYYHSRTGEDNGAAHLRRTIMGREVVIGVTGGQLDLGPWEQIFYGEFDGQRPKRVLVKIIGA